MGIVKCGSNSSVIGICVRTANSSFVAIVAVFNNEEILQVEGN